jgi:DNA-binding transcriptional LysR family regulator
VQLTPQGERLVRHAETILNAWTRAKHEVAVPDAGRVALSAGGIACLWDILLQDWLLALNANFPELSLTAEALSNDLLVRRIRDRTLDLPFSFERLDRPNPASRLLVHAYVVLRRILGTCAPDRFGSPFLSLEDRQKLRAVEDIKTENILRAERRCRIAEIRVRPGDTLTVGQVILEFE